MAKRLGKKVARLERLVYHEGFTLDEAVSVIDSERPEDRWSLREAFSDLPRRRCRTFVGLDSLPEIPAGASYSADSPIWERERLELSRKTYTSLAKAVLELSWEDRHLLQLRFTQGLCVSEISRRLRLDQRQLYGRLRRLLAVLRRKLESNGIRNADIEEILIGSGADVNGTEVFQLTSEARKSETVPSGKYIRKQAGGNGEPDAVERSAMACLRSAPCHRLLNEVPAIASTAASCGSKHFR
jgi:hypothetical protein